MTVSLWADVLDQSPDPEVVKSADFRDRMVETELPWRVRDQRTGIEMLLVPPGKFEMGASIGDEVAGENEKPMHSVTLKKAFYLGRSLVNQSEWVNIVGDLGKIRVDNPTHALWAWAGAFQRFCKVSQLRLPTEAEWEYACRGGDARPRYGDLDQIAWCGSLDRFETHPLRDKLPNALGFYDMIGNGWQLCADWYGERYYRRCKNGVKDPKGPKLPKESHNLQGVARGGLWFAGSEICRASYRRRLDLNDVKRSTTCARVARDP